MINESFLSQLKENVTIVNSARGALIDWNALIPFLEKNKSAAAFLDVFEVEPHPIEETNLLNLHMTSHIAGVHERLDEEIIEFEKTVIQDFQNLSEKDFSKKYQKAFLSGKILDGEFI